MQIEQPEGTAVCHPSSAAHQDWSLFPEMSVVLQDKGGEIISSLTTC